MGLVANTAPSSWERAVVMLPLPLAWNSNLMWLFQAPADAESGFQFLGLCSHSHGVCTPWCTVVKVHFTSTVYTFWTQCLGSAMYFWHMMLHFYFTGNCYDIGIMSIYCLLFRSMQIPAPEVSQMLGVTETRHKEALGQSLQSRLRVHGAGC